ncbi:hypothetical protein C8R32_102257 [Nitrosospira sp. Nsp5]|uniref:Uncharacterized protein n=1 Tax=Nitrosospira multiformis TaxID=1231 RepID=A0ABY0TK27_9PROT|nr:hypothetical protein C8R32_102257 [Nitrosospira sp. Nsp5]SDQ95970.1 hypothetical protein SAMN05216402_3000 [Nitrosospira multiformis]
MSKDLIQVSRNSHEFLSGLSLTGSGSQSVMVGLVFLIWVEVFPWEFFFNSA